MSSKPLILGYWATRSRAGVLRNLLDYCKLPYTQKLYRDPEEWKHDKKELGFKYPNLPYIIDDSKKMSETLALMTYIPRRAGRKDLVGDTDMKQVEVFEAIGVAIDLRDRIRGLVSTKGDFETEKIKLFTGERSSARMKLQQFNDVLKQREWLIGSDLTIADFYLFERLDLIYDMDPAMLQHFPDLVAFRERFLQIPEVANHRKSENFIALWQKPGETTWNNGDKW